MSTDSSADWRPYLRGLATDDAVLLGRGMEGAVYGLGGDRVAKVWFRRRSAELHVLRAFYEELNAQPLPFRVPEIFDAREVDDLVVTVERQLVGDTLAQAVESGRATRLRAMEVTVDVLAGLAAGVAGPAARALAVLDEQSAMWAGHDSWSDAVAALLHRRLAVSGDQLRAAVPDFDGKLERIFALLGQLPDTGMVIVHGDIIPMNILVDPECRPTALLDWGFFSTAGDPAFEASVAAGIFDMYSPEARAADDALIAMVTDRLGCSAQRLLLYRAIYAVTTANAYDPAGQDGQFAWAAQALHREDVTKALYADAAGL